MEEITQSNVVDFDEDNAKVIDFNLENPNDMEIERLKLEKAKKEYEEQLKKFTSLQENFDKNEFGKSMDYDQSKKKHIVGISNNLENNNSIKINKEQPKINLEYKEENDQQLKKFKDQLKQFELLKNRSYENKLKENLERDNKQKVNNLQSFEKEDDTEANESQQNINKQKETNLQSFEKEDDTEANESQQNIVTNVISDSTRLEKNLSKKISSNEKRLESLKKREEERKKNKKIK